MSRVTSKLQVTVPKAIADQYGIYPGAEIEWVAAGETIRVVPPGRQVQGVDREMRLKLFDAFRPSEAQWLLWNACPDPEFLADPRRGSPHSRGVAIDLTLVTRDGAELEMGTGFDAFTPLSHHANPQVPAAAQRNRAILLGIMTAAGWDFYRNEWWHYQLFNPRRYPLYSDSALAEGMM